MSKLYLEILDKERLNTFKLLKAFKKQGALAGGTAIALQIHHRLSYDFDIFLEKSVTPSLARKVRRIFGLGLKKTRDTKQQLSFITPRNVSVTFVKHPHPPLYKPVATNSIDLFDLKDLASNKAYTIGRRGMWRDYVDLFFLLKNNHVDLSSLIKETEKRFKDDFNPRLFLEQLIYTKDLVDFGIDYLGEKYEPAEIINYFKKLIRDYSRTNIA